MRLDELFNIMENDEERFSLGRNDGDYDGSKGLRPKFSYGPTNNKKLRYFDLRHGKPEPLFKYDPYAEGYLQRFNQAKSQQHINESQQDVVKNGFTKVSPIEPKTIQDELMSILKIDKMQPIDELHITIAYSTKTLPELKPNDYETEVTPLKYELFGEDDDILVLRVESKTLTDRHNDILEMGADYKWGEYKPHLTITYDVNSIDLPKDLSELELPKSFKVGNEKVEDLDLDYKPNKLEEAKVKKVWKKSGGKIVKKFRCVGGPKHGQLVSDRVSCHKRPDPIKSMRAKAMMRKNAKKIARKAAITKRTDPQSKLARMLNKQKAERKKLAKTGQLPKTKTRIDRPAISKDDKMDIVSKSKDVKRRTPLSKYIKSLEI